LTVIVKKCKLIEVYNIIEFKKIRSGYMENVAQLVDFQNNPNRYVDELR